MRAYLLTMTKPFISVEKVKAFVNMKSLQSRVIKKRTKNSSTQESSVHTVTEEGNLFVPQKVCTSFQSRSPNAHLLHNVYIVLCAGKMSVDCIRITEEEAAAKKHLFFDILSAHITGVFTYFIPTIVQHSFSNFYLYYLMPRLT